MKRILLLLSLIVLAAIIFVGGSESTFADGRMKDKGPKSGVVERILKSEPVLNDAGELVGTVEIVALESVNSSSAFTSAVVTSATSYKTCWVEFYLKNIYGQKVISYTLRQTFGYTGSSITAWYSPVTSSSTKWGWSGSDYQKGWYWRSRDYSATSWASATFTLKVAWFTVEQYRPTIGIDGYGSGSCYFWGYW